MTDSDNIIFDTASRIFDDLSTAEVINEAEEGKWPEDLWQAVSESGLTLAWVPEDNGGVGASMLEGFAVIKAAGGAAVPVPIAETLFAGWLLAQAGLQVSGEAATVVTGDLSLVDGKLSGSAQGVPFARNVREIVALVETADQVQVVQLDVSQLDAGQCEITAQTNLAGEPSDNVTFNAAAVAQTGVPVQGFNGQSVEAMGALIRCVQAAGALSTALELTIEYSMERVQFGRAIGKFQALQHSIAGFAGEVAAMNAAADSAAEAVDRAPHIDHEAWIEIATAKTRLEEAVNNGAAVAHQVHGAMGFTYEHSLHHLTRRLWAWRDEFGSDVIWARRLGEEVLSWGAEGLWPAITAVSDAR